MLISMGSKLKVFQLACGAGHSLVLTQTNQMFSWGCNTLGQLGHGDTQDRCRPTEITGLKERVITDIASGAGHCIALDSYGVLFTWGASADYQTGHLPVGEGILSQCITEPSRLEPLCQQGTQVLKVACGVKHTAVVTVNHELICFGSNEYGQCGDGRANVMKKNFEVNIHMRGKTIELVQCGGAHTLVKTSIQEIFAFGLNDKGQLGLGVRQELVSVPAKIKNFTSFKICKLLCAGNACLVTIRRVIGCIDEQWGPFRLGKKQRRPLSSRGAKASRACQSK